MTSEDPCDTQYILYARLACVSPILMKAVEAINHQQHVHVSEKHFKIVLTFDSDIDDFTFASSIGYVLIGW